MIAFYLAVAVLGSFSLSLLLYWFLGLDSTLTSLVINNINRPLYLGLYLGLTLSIIFLFGVNFALAVYHFRRFACISKKRQGPGAVGVFLAALASACPVCGSTILAQVGIVAGLAAFPFDGIELKAASLALLAFSSYKTYKNINSRKCNGKICLRPRLAYRAKRDKILFAAIIFLILVVSATFINFLKFEPFFPQAQYKVSLWPPKITKSEGDIRLYQYLASQVVPEQGYQSKISLNDTVLRLVSMGIIDRQKLDNYWSRYAVPEEISQLLVRSSKNPILLSRQNADFYLDLLWPVGLANYMAANQKSPIMGTSLFGFASTAGWKLGETPHGAWYFNRFNIIDLIPQQEAMVVKVSENIYRPCCNNSTFFQDCNHGSALLGLLELGASQGLSENELYQEALAFNAFWFQQNYLQTALYFKVYNNRDWEELDPREILSAKYSSSRGWRKNVLAKTEKIPNLYSQKDGSSCSL